MKNLFLTLSILLSFASTFSQNITAKLIDKNSNNPIPFASIKTGDYSGVITNEEGYFSISNENNDSTILNISCLGYKSKSLTIKDLKTLNFIVTLDEAFNQLNEIYLSNKKPNTDSIIARIKRNYHKNYDINFKNYSIFYRATNQTDFKNLHFEIDKASGSKKQQLDRANADLKALSKEIEENKSIYFTDFKGNLLVKNIDSCKLIISKATKLVDSKKNFSVDEVQNKAQKIVLKYLDTTKTYKVKSGLFKIKDSLSINDSYQEKKKSELQMNELKNNSFRQLKRSQIYNNSFLTTILNPKLYEYQIETVAYSHEDLTFIINFKPKKGKAKFAGKLYVLESNYAITKLDYSYFDDRQGKKLNLKLFFGIKYIETAKQGTIIYQKNSNNIYQPKYINHQLGNYFYLNRDLTLIENSKDKYKVTSSFKIEGTSSYKQEILFISNTNTSLIEYQNTKQEKAVHIKSLSKFDKGIWSNEETLEPLEEMKRFGTNQNK